MNGQQDTTGTQDLKDTTMEIPEDKKAADTLTDTDTGTETDNETETDTEIEWGDWGDSHWPLVRRM